MRLTKLGTIPALAAILALGACGGEEEGVGEGAVAETAAPVVEDVGATAVADYPYAEWDADRNRTLALNEFEGWIGNAGVYNRWNVDADAGIDQNEFGTAAFGLWDADDDNRLTETEWREGTGAWFEDDDYGAFADWDRNDDTFLDDEELGAGFGRTGLYTGWDANNDEFLDENEFGEGFFGVWDVNDDELLDENEWTTGYNAWWGI